MVADERIRGILFDSGGVLIRPVGGRWNPRFDFEEIMLAHHPRVRVELFPEAFAAGARFIGAEADSSSRADYHRTILRVLGIADPSTELLHELEAPPARPAVEPFPETRAVLDQLRAEGLPMCVVSDNWAGLDEVYRSLDLHGYFAGFVISEVLGCRKPDPRMYAAGSGLLGLDPAVCLFVDDDPELVEAAVDLGYQGVAVTRGGDPPTTVPSIATLTELPPIVARTASRMG
jgi:HAD superfamily hydrolase (TIGR01509 family)